MPFNTLVLGTENPKPRGPCPPGPPGLITPNDMEALVNKERSHVHRKVTRNDRTGQGGVMRQIWGSLAQAGMHSVTARSCPQAGT